LRSSPWIRGALHSGLAMLISRISRRISTGTIGRPPRRLDFQGPVGSEPGTMPADKGVRHRIRPQNGWQACGWEQAPRYLIRDRDGVFGELFIPIPKNAFEMSVEFPLFCQKLDSETFAAASCGFRKHKPVKYR